MKYLRIILLTLLGVMHLIWILYTGSDYMSDVLTKGKQFFPLALPYGLLAATLSFLFGSNKIEKFCALALYGIIAIALLQAASIKVDGDRYHLFSKILRQLKPKYSIAPWILIGLCFQQIIVSTWRRKKYFKHWKFPCMGFILAYAILGFMYISSRINPRLPIHYSSWLDIMTVLCLGSILFGVLSIPLMKLYNISILTFSNPTEKESNQGMDPTSADAQSIVPDD